MRRAPSIPSLRSAFMVIMGLDHVDQFRDIVRHHEAGTIPPTVMWGACPTLFDPSQAPPGRHTGVHVGEAALSSATAIRRTGIAARDEHGRAMLRALAAARAQSCRRRDRLVHALAARHRALRCPTCARAICWSAPSPTVRSAITARSPAPAPTARIFPGSISADRAAIPAATSPGLPGYNAAQVILADLGAGLDLFPQQELRVS